MSTAVEPAEAPGEPAESARAGEPVESARAGEPAEPAGCTNRLTPPHVAFARLLFLEMGATIAAQTMIASSGHITPTTPRALGGLVDVPRLWGGVTNPPTCRAVKTNVFRIHLLDIFEV